MLSLKRMNSKLIELLFLIAVFLIACSFGKPSKCSKSSKWIPVKYTKSELIYDYADSSARHYFLQQRKRDPNDIEVCHVSRVIQNGKKYVLSFTAKAKDCNRSDIGKDCWQRLHANITVRNKYVYTVVDVRKINNEPFENSMCHFRQFNWNKF